MASDRSDDIDHLDFDTPQDLERQLRAAAVRPAQPAPAPERRDDLDDDGPTRLPGHHLRRAVVILVALLLLVALFLSSGILGLFRLAPAPSDGDDGTVNATAASSAPVAAL